MDYQKTFVEKVCSHLCYDMYQCIVDFEYSLHLMLGRLRTILQTYFKLCQDRNPAVTVATHGL